MAQTVPLSIVLGPQHTGLAIGYRVLDIDRVEYSAFTTDGVVETNVAGTYAVAGGVVVPIEGGYIEVSRRDGEIVTPLAETAVDGGIGSGSSSYSDTITDAGGNLLDGVYVYLASDPAGAHPVASTVSNALGQFWLAVDPGTYYRFLQLGGYRFTQAVEVIVP